MKLFLKYVTQRETLARSLRVASVVGSILGVINHYDMFASGNFQTRRLIQFFGTFLVPFCVSTYSSAMQGRANELRQRARGLELG
jgi:hypothetical protein